jgi:hypothetical protein
MFLHQTKILVVLVTVCFKGASKADSFVDVMRLEAQSISQPILAFLLAVVWVSVCGWFVPLISALLVWLDRMVERRWVRQLFSSGTSWLWPPLRSSWDVQRRLWLLGLPCVVDSCAGRYSLWVSSTEEIV